MHSAVVNESLLNIMTNAMKKIYLSLPVRGRSNENVREHVDMVKAALSRKGFDVVSPLDNYCGKSQKYNDSLCHNLRMMLDCDGVCFCNGWTRSLECTIEHDVVLRFNASENKNFTIVYE